jgi:cytochrome c6
MLKLFISILLLLFSFNQKIEAKNLELGKELFIQNCNVCHLNFTNIIIPEKNLKKTTLIENGMNNLDSILYQISNGKNGMPGFGSRLTNLQIEEIANYVLESSKE